MKIIRKDKETSKIFPFEKMAYQEGRKAFCEGKCRIGCCPYNKIVQGCKHHSWQEGFSDGYEVFHGGKEV